MKKKRRSALRMPDLHWMIKFKYVGDVNWTEGEVVSVEKAKRLNNTECEVLLLNDDLMKVDIAKTQFHPNSFFKKIY